VPRGHVRPGPSRRGIPSFGQRTRQSPPLLVQPRRREPTAAGVSDRSPQRQWSKPPRQRANPSRPQLQGYPGTEDARQDLMRRARLGGVLWNALATA
jgi:hypothetical protein